MKKVFCFWVAVIFFSLTTHTFSGTLGDINSDGKIDLREAIYALQVVAGVKPQIDALNLSGTWNINRDNTDICKWIFVQQDSNVTVTYNIPFTGTVYSNELNLTFIDEDNTTYTIMATLTDQNHFSGTILSSDGYSGNIFGEKISSETNLPIINIPVANINIDGDMADWTSVEVLIQDDLDPSLNVPGSDLEYVKLALNSEKTRLYFLIKVTDSINTNIWYRMWFDNDMDGEIDGEPDDRQVDFEYRNDQWEVISQDMAETGNYNIPDDGEVAVINQYIEGSVAISILGIADEFFFSGRTMKADPYEKYNKFNKFGIVKIK